MVKPIYGVNRAYFYNVVESRTAGEMPVYKSKTNSKPLINSQLHNKTETNKDSPFIKAIKSFIDIINPLQHIPIISSIYRFMTGDKINPAAKIAGDTLYGGPVNGAISLAGVAYEKVTGEDIGQTIISNFSGHQNTYKHQEESIALNTNSSPKISDIIWSTPEKPQQINKIASTYIQGEDIALKMMEALDKYSAMKTAKSPQITSGLY